MSVSIGYCHPDNIVTAFHTSLVQLLLTDAKNKKRVVNNGSVIGLYSGPRIATGRNQLVHGFLRTNSEWLLMLDADMVFPCTLIEDLWRAASPTLRPIVGGLCFAGGKSGKVWPTLYRLDQNKELETMAIWPANQLVEVTATGAACLFIHRSVFEKMQRKFEAPHHWFVEATHNGKEYGEDIAFCLRARALGFPIYVHTGIEIGHVKYDVLNTDTYWGYRKEADEVGEEAMLKKYLRKYRLIK